MNRGVTSRGISAVGLAVVVSFVFLLPKIMVWSSSVSGSEARGMAFKLGLENISPQFLHKLAARKSGALTNEMPTIALITNQSGKDQAGNRNIDVLMHKGVSVAAVIVPESGDMHRDGTTNIPFLYAASAHDFAHIEPHVAKVDAFFFDMQDIGARAFTHKETLVEVMRMAVRLHKPLVILDRPNPLGASMEGIIAPHKETSAPLAAVPTRYGMTIGELAHFFNQNIFNKTVSLMVVPMEDYHRQLHQELLPAGSLTTQATLQQECRGYSLLRLLCEVEPFDVGVGTEKAFQTILLPERLSCTKNKWYELRALLQDFGIESKYCRIQHPLKKEPYCGLQLFMQDGENSSSFKGTMAILEFFMQAGVQLTFSPQFDDVAGSPKVRAVVQGACQKQELEAEMNQGLRTFFKQASRSFLYTPFPKMVVA